MSKIIIRSSVEKFIRKSSETTSSRIMKMIKLLSELEYKLSMPYAKKITSNIYELRIRGKQEIRIFYTFKKDRIILFHSFVKKTNKLPKRELKTVINKLKKLENI